MAIADMVRSVALVLAIVLGFVGYQALVRDDVDAAPMVDYTTAAAAARVDAPFEVLAPEQLPAGWRATSARYTREPTAHWHLGVLTDEDDYVGLEQIVDDADDALAAFSADTSAVGSTAITGQRWQVWADASGTETTLVRSSGELSILVTGTAPRDVLVGFIESLRP